MTMLLEGLGRENKGHLSAYINQETLNKIDALRGKIPRSRVVQRALELFLKMEKTSEKRNAVAVVANK